MKWNLDWLATVFLGQKLREVCGPRKGSQDYLVFSPPSFLFPSPSHIYMENKADTLQYSHEYVVLDKSKNILILHHNVQGKLQRSSPSPSYKAVFLQINLKAKNIFKWRQCSQFLSYIYMSNKLI